MTTAVLKDPELQRYYDAMFTLYALPGWRYLMEDVARIMEGTDRVSDVETVEQLWKRKGSLEELNYFLNHQQSLETAYAQLLAKQEGTEEEKATGGVAKVIDPNAPQSE